MLIERKEIKITIAAGQSYNEVIEVKGINVSIEVVSDQLVNISISTTNNVIVAVSNNTTSWIWSSQPGDWRIHPVFILTIKNSNLIPANVKIYINQGVMQ